MKVDALSLCHELVPNKPLFVVTSPERLSHLQAELIRAQLKRLTEHFGGHALLLDGGMQLTVVRVAPETIGAGIDALWSG